MKKNENNTANTYKFLRWGQCKSGKYLKKVISVLLVFGIFIITMIAYGDEAFAARSKKSAFITNRKFVGTFSYEGKKGSFKDGWYNLVIDKITSNGEIRFRIDKGGRNGSPLYQTEILTARIERDRVNFKWKEDGWGNRGKGTIVFKKNGQIVLTVKETYTADWNRSSLTVDKVIFKKTSKEHKIDWD